MGAVNNMASLRELARAFSFLLCASFVAPGAHAKPDTKNQTDLASEFEIKRQAFHSLWPESDFALVSGYEDSYILFHCSGPADLLGNEQVSENDLSAVLAMDIAFMQRGLEATGAPKDIWQPKIDMFVSDTLSTAKYETSDDQEAYRERYQKFLEQITAELNRVVVQHPAKWPENTKVRYDPMTGCGGDEGANFKIELSQRGKLFVISRWGSLVCEGRKISPFDRTKCRGWKPVGVPSAEPFRGDLMYLVNWDSGTESRGMLDLAKRPNISSVVISPGGPAYTLRMDDEY